LRKKTSYRFFLFALCLLTCVARAETISGNCSILEKPHGAEQFSLVPGTEVHCSMPAKGWCMVLFKAFIDKKYVYDGIRIRNQARIRNAAGKNVGRVLTDMNPYRTIIENDTCFVMEMAGYIEVMCIEDTSIVEHSIEKLYAKQDSLLGIAVFNRHLREFAYTQWVSKGPFYSFLLKETDIVNSKPGLRVAVIFDRDKAVAILHRRKLHIQAFESAMHTQRYSLVYLGRFSEAYKKQVADLFLPEADSLYE
jgi:hypothetical protein